MSSVTVVIPTHNRPAYLRQAIASVLAQADPPPRIIVIDDGGDAPAEAMLDSGQRAICECIRNEPGKGVSAARNQGAARADSEWLLFLDDDDWLAPGFLAAFEQRARDARGAADLFWSQKIPVRDSELAARGNAAIPPVPTIDAADDSERELVGLMNATCSGMAIRREAFMRVGGFDDTLAMSEDRDLVFKLLAAGCRARPLAGAGLFFRIHDGPRLSSSDRNEVQARADLTVLLRHEHFLAQHPALAERFMGRVAKRLWQQRYVHDALAVSRLQCRIEPRSVRARRRLLLWRLAALFRQSRAPLIQELTVQ